MLEIHDVTCWSMPSGQSFTQAELSSPMGHTACCWAKGTKIWLLSVYLPWGNRQRSVTVFACLKVMIFFSFMFDSFIVQIAIFAGGGGTLR